MAKRAKTPTLPPSYFDISALPGVRNDFNALYSTNNAGTDWFKQTAAKLDYLIGLLATQSGKPFHIVYKELPNSQARPPRLKTYVLRGFSSKEKDSRIFIKIEIRGLQTTNPKFIIEFDTNKKKSDNSNPFSDFLNNDQSENFNYEIPFDQTFPDNWNDLVNQIAPQVISMENTLNRLQNSQDIGNLIVVDKSNLPNGGPNTNPNLNTILFGPPGTGKTFHSINHAVAIIKNDYVESIVKEAESERAAVKARFDDYLNNGSAVFTTFHQSLSYEDFIEGIKPIEPEPEEDQLTYAVEDGIFKRLCTEAAFTYVKQQANKENIEQALDFSTAYDRLVDRVNEKLANGELPEIATRSGGRLTIENVTAQGNFRVRHINGVKTYVVSKRRLGKISQVFQDLSALTNIDEQFRAEIGGSNSSAYWAVLNAIRNQGPPGGADPVTADIEKDYSYEDKKEIIKSLKSEDYRLENPNRFVLVIDEINRGNVSQIFGELITLIEEDKRLGKEEALTVTLPYSKERFGVPPNIYIVGTMNTADRSVESLDTALRRRFSFVPKMPEAGKLGVTTDGIDLRKVLDTINTRLRILKDNDHTIGHAWLWNVKNVYDLKAVYEHKILPLLQEYFYNDYEKLGLVLGDAFFKEHKQIDSSVFAKFTGSNGLAGQYNQTWQYELKPSLQLDVSNFKTLETVSLHSIDANEGE